MENLKTQAQYFLYLKIREKSTFSLEIGFYFRQLLDFTVPCARFCLLRDLVSLTQKKKNFWRSDDVIDNIKKKN